MNECPACHTSLEVEARFCTSCGFKIDLRCLACQRELQPAWKLCPHCGAASPRAASAAREEAAPAMGASARDLGWGVRSRLQALYNAPLEALQKRLDSEKGLPDLLETWSAERLAQACLDGLRAMGAAEGDPTLPAVIRRCVARIGKESTTLAARLDPALKVVGAAVSALQGTTLLESGTQAFLRSVGDALKPSASRDAARSIGGLLLPGGGEVVGVMLWKLYQEQQKSSADQVVLKQYLEALTKAIEAYGEVFDHAWDALTGFVLERGGPALERAAFFEQARKRIERFGEELPSGDEMAARVGLDALLTEIGAAPDLVHALVRAYLPPDPSDVAAAARWAGKQLEVHPNKVVSYEDAADVAIEQGDPARALELADTGLLRDPAHAGLRATRLEALAWLGRTADASALIESLGQEGHNLGAVLYNARGLARGGQIVAATAALQAWIQAAGHPAAARYQIRRDPFIASLVAQGKIALGGGPGDDLRGIVEAHLGSDGKNYFEGPPPPSMLEHAKAHFLALDPGEEVLFFLDWTLLTSGSKGFAITSKRVEWRDPFLDSPHRLALADIDPARVSCEDGFVVFGDARVSITLGLAERVAGAVKELAAHVRCSP